MGDSAAQVYPGFLIHGPEPERSVVDRRSIADYRDTYSSTCDYSDWIVEERLEGLPTRRKRFRRCWCSSSR